MDRKSSNSFDEFFRTEHDSLLRMCWAVTLDRDEALDVAQDVMCRAYQRWDSICDSNPVGWTRTVALNVIRSRWRRHRTARRFEGHLRVVRDVELSPLDADLVDAMKTLSARQREAVALHHLLDLDVASVADVMECSESSVKAHLLRGRAHLERLLRDTHDPNRSESGEHPWT